MSPGHVVPARRAALGALLLGSLLGATAAAQQGVDWRAWRYVVAIDLPPVSQPAFAAVVVSPEVAGRVAAGWADLRVVDDRDEEQPYVVRVRRGGRAVVWREVRLLSPGFVPNAYTQAVLDTGAAVRVHNRVRIDVGAGEDFLTWMEMAVSDDSQDLAGHAGTGADLLALERAGLDTWLEASYPDSTSRYVRVRLLEGARRFALVSASVAEEIDRLAEMRQAPVTFAAVTSRSADRSVWESTPPTPGLAMAELRFSAADPLFSRPVLVEASDDGVNWRRAAAGHVSRVQERSGVVSALTVRVHVPAAARWRVTVYDRSDRALTRLQITAFETPRRVVFRQEPGRTYRLRYGHPRVSAPSYDLARQVDDVAFDAAIDGTIGAQGENADYRDPRPWTEQHPVVLWSAAALAILVLGAIAVRTLREK